MDADDTVLIFAVVLVVSIYMIYRNNASCGTPAVSASVNTPVGGVALVAQQRERLSTRRGGLGRERMDDPSVGMPNGATQQRMLNRATMGDANAKFAPQELFPESTQHLDEDWKTMFSASENTLAQENFIEPSYEYAIGTINIPKRWLNQDLRGNPEVTTYDNLTPWNNSAYGSLDLTEGETRRALE
jgi:hypothetical protein